MEVCIINERIIHSNRSYSLIEVLDLDEDEDAKDYGQAGHVAVHSHEVGGGDDEDACHHADGHRGALGLHEADDEEQVEVAGEAQE